MKHTVQEWADITGGIAAMNEDGSVYSFSTMPCTVEGEFDEDELSRWLGSWAFIEAGDLLAILDDTLVIPPTCDWRDSLCYPKEENK